jgi:epsilon-lactone hydrolase
MDSEFAPRISAPPYYRLVPRIGGESAQFIIDNLLRLSLKRLAFTKDAIHDMRKRIALVDHNFGQLADDIRISRQSCEDVRAEWLEVPQSRLDRVLLYLHGGAFCFRMPRIQAGMLGRWCRRSGARALMPAYRLAPEHPYPAASDDCLAAYRWLLNHGVPAHNIVICGDSAGGNLALVTLMRARDEDLPLPAAAILLSPSTDFSLSGRSATVNEKSDPMFTMPLLRWFGEMYLSEPELHLTPLVSPLTGDFSGLPPLLFQVGSNEMLLDDSTRAAAKAHGSGVVVQLDVFEGMPHVFQAIGQLPESKLADKYVAEFLEGKAGWGRV